MAEVFEKEGGMMMSAISSFLAFFISWPFF